MDENKNPTTARDLLEAIKAQTDMLAIVADQNRRMLEGAARVEKHARSVANYAGWICLLVILWMLGTALASGHTQSVQVESISPSYGR